MDKEIEKEIIFNNKIEKVHISEIKHKDTILIDGEMITVGKNDIKNDPFYGMSIHGEYFRHTQKMVDRVLFRKWYQGEIVDWVTQL